MKDCRMLYYAPKYHPRKKTDEGDLKPIETGAGAPNINTHLMILDPTSARGCMYIQNI